MIPDLPSAVSLESKLDFYAKLAGNLSDQSSVHVNWHTHRQNPSVCWICDTHTLTSKILDVIDKILTKSPLDIGTELSSEEESDSEIEQNINLNVDDENYNEPEYDVEENLDTTEEVQ